MLSLVKRWLIDKALSPEDRDRIDSAPIEVNSVGIDEWGLEPETLKASLGALKWLYKDYFRVETTGIERVPEGRALIIANHGGQLPLDGLLVCMSLVLEGQPPRFARGMVERWFPSLPFVSTLFMRCGQMVGDQRNCRDLLTHGQTVLVFPEGTRGSGKLIGDAYKLQRFGTGFVRLALETKTPIVPVAIIGCEETYPGILNLKGLAKMVGAPYLPVTPFWPLLGPLGAIPLPAKVTLRFGEPIHFEGDPEAPDAVIEDKVRQVREALQAEIDEGLRKRGGHIFTGSGK